MPSTLPPAEAVRAAAREAAAAIEATLEPAPLAGPAGPAAPLLTIRGPRVEVATPSGTYALDGPSLEVPGAALPPLAGLVLVATAAVALLTLRR
jgi:hypothetical protein